MNTIIEFKNVCKSYDDKTVIDNFSLAIEKGEFVTIIGKSGCGKTTALKMVNLLIKPDSGTVFIDGENINTLDPIKLRRKIGYSIQGNVLFPHMNVCENISYVLNLDSKLNADSKLQIVDNLLTTVGLEDNIKNRYPFELSGGQQQRVGIARALSASPKIVLMDEPFGAVDEITRRQLQKELLDIHKKTRTTILFVTHDISEALKLGSKVLVIDKGTIQQYDTPKNIVKNPKTEIVKMLIE